MLRKARKNVTEGRGVSLGGVMGKEEPITNSALQILCGERH